MGSKRKITTRAEAGVQWHSVYLIFLSSYPANEERKERKGKRKKRRRGRKKKKQSINMVKTHEGIKSIRGADK